MEKVEVRVSRQDRVLVSTRPSEREHEAVAEQLFEIKAMAPISL